MGWQDLLRDLEAQAEAAQELIGIDEAADRTRQERAQVALADRLRACRGLPLALELVEGAVVRGPVLETGPDWLLIGPEHGPALEAVVPLAAVRSLRGMGGWADAAPMGATASRLDLRWVLGRLARDRAHVRLRLTGGAVLEGTVDRVGADHLDLVVHDGDALRRSAEIVEHRVVPLAVLVLIERPRAAPLG
jgi:hypothetical protein